MWCQKEKEFNELKDQFDGLVRIVNKYPEEIKNLQEQLDRMTRIAKYAGDEISCRLESEFSNGENYWSWRNTYTLYIYPDRDTELKIELPELTGKYVASEFPAISITECGLAKVICSEYVFLIGVSACTQHEFLIDLSTLKYIYKTNIVPIEEKKEEEPAETKSSGIDIRYQFDYSSDGSVKRLHVKKDDGKLDVFDLSEFEAKMLDDILKRGV